MKEPVHDLLGPAADPLRSFFAPRTIALIGASEREGSVGRTTLENLYAGSFHGKVFAVNPRHKMILGRPAFPSITAIPEKVELAVIATPAATVPEIVRDCVAAEVPAAVILSAGFRETGPAGRKLEEEVKTAAAGKIRILGPNCLGLMSPAIGLNATFAQKLAGPGNVAFLSQSGALCTAILDWSEHEGIGFSAFVSVGSMADVEWGSLLEYFGRDPSTTSIVMYMESIPDARSFLSAARKAALAKPIVVIKAGRTAAAAHAAASHTGALTGNDAVLDAAFARAGVLRVDTISELFHLSDVLAKQPLPNGPRLGILTNAGGPGVLAADAVARRGKATLATLSPATLDSLNAFLPPHWSHGNPVDIIGDADPERFRLALEVVARDPNMDGLLVIMTPQGMTDPATVASIVADVVRPAGKPLLASWMGGESVSKGMQILARKGIATFSFPDDAVCAFDAMCTYRQRIADLYETPLPVELEEPSRRRLAEEIVQTARKEDRLLLSEYESKRVLEAHGIPVVRTELATSREEAMVAAERIGFPVALKVHSYTVTHKTDVGGVRLSARDRESVGDAFNAIRTSVEAKAGSGAFLGVTVQAMAKPSGIELILGSSVDEQFGPVVLFGAGGTAVEIFHDTALGLPPFNSSLAKQLIGQTKIAKALGGLRGQAPVDRERLASLLVRFGDLVVTHPEIAEIDINPLLASSDGLLALDARIVLHPKDRIAVPRPAIRPYPLQYAQPWKTLAGESTEIRPLRPEDETMVAAFHSRLSGDTVEQRYGAPFTLTERAAHARLARICHCDYDDEIALACLRGKEIVGIARITRLPDRTQSELSILVEDKWQGHGVGSELVERLIKIASLEGIHCIKAQVNRWNSRMRTLLLRKHFIAGADESLSLNL